MNHQILQDSISSQREVKSLLGAIGKGKEGGSAMGHSSKRPIKKWSRHEDSKKLSRERWGNQRNVGNVEDITYVGIAQRGNIKRAATTKFLGFGIS